MSEHGTGKTKIYLGKDSDNNDAIIIDTGSKIYITLDWLKACYNDRDRGDFAPTVLPTKIGFLTCAGGGGAGGFGYYDQNKDGNKSTVILCPGSGGGGAGILLGVLDLTGTNSKNYFCFDVGVGGVCGKNNTTVYPHNDGIITKNGCAGKNTCIYRSIPGKNQLLATVYGGGQGLGGTKGLDNTGGNGGSVTAKTNKACGFYVAGYAIGEQGCSASKAQTETKTMTYSLDLKNSSDCAMTITNDSLKANYSSKYDEKNVVCTFPGGSSIGKAVVNTSDKSEDDHYGAGGTEYGSTNISDYNKISKGRNGRLWLYY